MSTLGRGLPRAYWLVAAAFACSWVGDTLSHRWDMWDVTYWWLPVQIGLVLLAMTFTLRRRALVVFGVPMVALAASHLTVNGADVVLTVTGSGAILSLADGPLWQPLALYFGVGSVAYLLMVAEVFPAWYPYQACRLLAFASFGRLVWRLRLT